MKKQLNDPNGWVVFVETVQRLLGDGADTSYRPMLNAYIKGVTAEEYVKKLRKAATKEWRQWVKDHHGSWRNWALDKVANNPRIRKRLPRITAKAKLLKGITSDELVKW